MTERLCRDPNHLLDPAVPPAVMALARGERMNPLRGAFARRWLRKQIAGW